MTQPFHLLPRVGSSMAEEWLDIGLNHHVVNKFAEAEQAYAKGLRVDPNNGPLTANLGVLAAQQGNILLALQRLERSVLLDDKNSTTWYNYALALLEGERADESLPVIQRSLDLAEGADALCAKAMILTSLAKAAEAAEVYDKSLVKNPAHPMASFNAIFARTLKNTTPTDNYAARKRWHDVFKWCGTKQPHSNEKVPYRKLRVGYVGGDFKMHSASFFFGKVILHHNRKLCDPYCYMSMTPNPNDDHRTKLFMEKTNWRDISAKNDDEAETMIRADQIDILVDLSGHTGGNRLVLFTRKPAPIQVHAWGFAHGSGCPEIDYFFADEYSIPQDERSHFAEEIWDLPCIIGYEPPDYNQAGASSPPVARDGVFTFGVFGRFEKYSPQSLEAWHKILLRTPNSRLIIKDLMMRRPHAIKRVREVMHDVDPKRILFMQDCSHPEQLLTYQTVDLVLDTFPHTGGVTALEIIYMGTPIVTLYNGQVGGRTTSAALRAIGHQDWVATSIDDYVRKAVKLATERTEVGKARETLREKLLKSPVCNGYTEAVENAYRQMWWRYCGVRSDTSVVEAVR
jgi:protein O-GlcNAc transferase